MRFGSAENGGRETEYDDGKVEVDLLMKQNRGVDGLCCKARGLVRNAGEKATRRWMA